jgi:hypothetical protein
MDIQPQYVDFNTAKLLKEKGFDVKIRAHYKDRELIYSGNLFNWNDSEEQKRWTPVVLSAPEIWMVVEWLRLKHSIWIFLQPQTLLGEKKCENYYYTIVENDITHSSYFNSPQEAYLFAIDYTLKNLI